MGFFLFICLFFAIPGLATVKIAALSCAAQFGLVQFAFLSVSIVESCEWRPGSCFESTIFWCVRPRPPAETDAVSLTFHFVPDRTEPSRTAWWQHGCTVLRFLMLILAPIVQQSKTLFLPNVSESINDFRYPFESAHHYLYLSHR